MTLQRAYDLLRARWPGRSFSIGITCWHHQKTREPRLTYSVYDAQYRVAYEAASLDLVLEKALGCDADLATVDAQLKGFAP